MSSLRYRPALLAFGVVVSLLVAYAVIFLPYMPDVRGFVGIDYSFWLPNLLVGYFWHLNNGLLSLPWFSPAGCGGVPFYADPEMPYLSLPQFLTFVLPPVKAIQLSTLMFAAFGFCGAHYLAKVIFRLSGSASVLAGTLFMFNNFSAARLMVGHLTFETFLLTPIIASAILSNRQARLRDLALWAPVCLAGLVITAMIQGGAVHVLPPALLSVAIVAVMHAIRFGASKAVFLRFVGAVGIGCALSAGKLAASFALIRNLPRNQYLLPGIEGADLVFWRAFQTLFIGPPEHPEAAAVHSMWALQRHEWEYGVSIVPLVLMVLWLTKSLARPQRPKQLWLWVGLVVLLAVPVALNWYQPGWNDFLKSLPFLGNSSNLLRWFAAYIVPACLAGALGLDTAVPKRLRPAISALGVAFVVGSNSLTDRSFYGPRGQGGYRVDTIEAAWHAARKAGTGPRITSIRVPTDQQGHIVLTPNRDDALAYGYSQLLCSEPLFGYSLERFPIGALHPGPALESHAGALNIKNPACYVFPGANACAPGDSFPEARAADAAAFLDYAPFPFRKPLWAHLADWLGVLTACTLGLSTMGAAVSSTLKPRMAARLRETGSRVLAQVRRAGKKLVAIRISRQDTGPNLDRGKIAIGKWALGPRIETRELVDLGRARPAADLADSVKNAAPAGLRAPDADKDGVAANVTLPSNQAAARPDGLIEIVLPSGIIVRVDTSTDAEALHRVLGVLARK